MGQVDSQLVAAVGEGPAGSRGRVVLDDDGHTRGGRSTLACDRVRDALLA
jgi:hypothetical protein